MDPEQERQLTESIIRLEETVNNLSSNLETLSVLTPRFGGSVKAAGADIDKLREFARKAGETLEEYTERIEKLTALQAAQMKAEEEKAKAAENTRNAMYSLSTGMGQFRDALLNTERTLGKYSNALDSAGDAAIDLGKNFGVAGLAVGVAVKGFTSLTAAGLKQADAQLKATDALAKVGATGRLTTDQVLDMGQAAGLVSKNLDLFTKPIQSMGPALITLGGSSANAVTEFGKLTAISAKQRQEFQRLGVSQEELIQNQADFIKLQQMSGVQITDNMKKDGNLRRASLEYTENLLKLSAITGKSVEEAKKDQEVARAGYATLLQTNKLQRQIDEAERLGLTDRASALKAELNARNKLLDTVQAQIGDAELLAGVQQFLATGAYTEVSQSLLQLGLPMEQFRQQIIQGKDVTAEFMEAFKQGVDKNNEALGTSAALIGPEMGKIFGLTDQTLKARAAMGERDEKEIRQRTAEEIAAGKKAGLDGIKDARATFTEAEIVLQKAVDNIVQTLNPLQLGFIGATAAAGALAVAAFGAARALGGVAASGAIDNVVDVGGGGRLGQLFKGGTSLAKFGGALTGVVAVGSGIATAMQGSKAADQAVAEGTMTKVQGEQAKEEAKYTGGGEAVGGVIGGALGMLAGPLGAAIGGTIGSKLGGFIGGWIASRDDEEKLAEAETQEAQPQQAGPPPTLEDLRDAQRIAAGIQDQNAALTAFNQRLNNVQALAVPAAGTTPAATVPAATETTAPAVTTPVTPAVAAPQKYTFEELSKDEVEKARKYYESMGMNADQILQPSYFNQAALDKRQKLFETLRKPEDAAVIAGATTETVAATPKVESTSEEQRKEKSFFDRNKGMLAGLALGTLAGPLGMAVGGWVGSKFDKDEKEDVKEVDEDLDLKAAKEAALNETVKLNTNFKNLSSSLEVVAKNVQLLDRNFDDVNFAFEQMVTDLSGEGDTENPAEAVASNFKNAFTMAMLDLRNLQRRTFTTSGSESSEVAAGGGATGGGVSTAPSVASAEPSGGMGSKGGVSLPLDVDFTNGKAGNDEPIAQVVDAGPGFTTVKTEDGSVQKRVGARNWRNNNPGNLNYGRFAKEKDAVGSDGRFAVFPTLQDGMDAKKDLVFGKNYVDLSIAQAISKYAPPTENDTNMYISKVVEATNASPFTLLRDLNASQRDAMLATITKVEGFKPGKIIEGAMGGIVSGPQSGFPALLHGREAIVPLAPNSFLEKLAKTPETAPITSNITTTQQVDSPALNQSIKELTAINAEMMNMMQDKFDEMIERLGTGNDISKKMYKAALV